MTIKTIEFKPERLSPKECKVCGETATFISYDTKANDVGPSIHHCKACTAEAKKIARFFITPAKIANHKSLEDMLGY